jgi:copper transporter 1
MMNYQMLWNWNTIDSCFISSSWQIKSAGMMAGSCIGVILLVMTLELLRRASKEYDRYLIKQSALAHSHSTTIAAPSYNSSDNNSNKGALATSTPAQEAGVPVKRTVRPTIFQQAVRATLHMVQFTIAYFVMLLAMYYNGYLIISIIIGAWLGAFVFSWGNLDVGYVFQIFLFLEPRANSELTS